LLCARRINIPRSMSTYKTTFRILKMDCPSEEHLVRMGLQGLSNVRLLNFDLDKRQLIVFHTNGADSINAALQSLNLETTLIDSIQSDTVLATDRSDRKLLWVVLIINFSFFILELLTGILSRSMGLVADSLDMLADALVYGLALFAIGGPMIRKFHVAKFAGYFQVILASIGIIEVIRRFFGEENIPNFQTMILISALALIANAISLYILHKGKSNEVHMKASMIFTSNDIIINVGVIMAGLLVNWLDSGYPDLIIGTIVFLIVVRGAFRILKLSKVMKEIPSQKLAGQKR
jgi:Co/Zn/Cd efflux system component